MGHFHAALVADDATEAHLFVFTAIALPILSGTKDRLAKEAIFLRAQTPVVDRFRLGHFAVGPGTNLFRRCETDPHAFDIVEFQVALLVHRVADFDRICQANPNVRLFPQDGARLAEMLQDVVPHEYRHESRPCFTGLTRRPIG